MTPDEWLKGNAPGFAELSPEELRAVSNFALLWSYIEARAFGTEANPRRIIEVCDGLEREGKLAEAAFAGELEYFRKRYWQEGAPTDYWFGLRWRPNDPVDLVRAVLAGEDLGNSHVLAVLLLIAYRYRNNLLHGSKWAYGLRDQLENFSRASEVLMRVLDLYKGPTSESDA